MLRSLNTTAALGKRARNPKITTLLRLVDDPDQHIYQSIAPLIIERGHKAVHYLQVASETTANPLVRERCEEMLSAIAIQFPAAPAPVKEIGPEIVQLVQRMGGDMEVMAILASASYTYQPPPERLYRDLLDVYGIVMAARCGGLLGETWSIVNDICKGERPSKHYTKDYIERRKHYVIHDKDAEQLVDAVCRHLRENPPKES